MVQQIRAEAYGYGIYNQKSDIESLLVSGLFFVISKIQKPSMHNRFSSYFLFIHIIEPILFHDRKREQYAVSFAPNNSCAVIFDVLRNVIILIARSPLQKTQVNIISEALYVPCRRF